jgi:hypothetical protein
MMSSYNEVDLFGSGPHRFVLGPLGEYVLTLARIDPFQAGSQAIGPLEETVVVRGRLVALTEEGVWALVDAIHAELTDPPTVATLVDEHEREWEGMSFIRFEAAEPTQRGRAWSLGYEAVFIRLAT